MNHFRRVFLRSICVVCATAFSVALLTSPASAATVVGYPVAGAVPEAGNAGAVITQRRNLDAGGSTYPGFSTGGILTSISIRIKVKVTPKASTSTTLTAKVKTPGETATSDNSAKTKVKFKLEK